MVEMRMLNKQEFFLRNFPKYVKFVEGALAVAYVKNTDDVKGYSGFIGVLETRGADKCLIKDGVAYTIGRLNNIPMITNIIKEKIENVN